MHVAISELPTRLAFISRLLGSLPLVRKTVAYFWVSTWMVEVEAVIVYWFPNPWTSRSCSSHRYRHLVVKGSPWAYVNFSPRRYDLGSNSFLDVQGALTGDVFYRLINRRRCHRASVLAFASGRAQGRVTKKIYFSSLPISQGFCFLFVALCFRSSALAPPWFIGSI